MKAITDTVYTLIYRNTRSSVNLIHHISTYRMLKRFQTELTEEEKTSLLIEIELGLKANGFTFDSFEQFEEIANSDFVEPEYIHSS